MAKFTFEVACNTPIGLWKVADRPFYDRRLTLGERRRAMSVQNDEAFLAAALTYLLVDGDPITEEWVESSLSEQDLRVAVAYVLGGQSGVDKHLKGLADG